MTATVSSSQAIKASTRPRITSAGAEPSGAMSADRTDRSTPPMTPLGTADPRPSNRSPGEAVLHGPVDPIEHERKWTSGSRNPQITFR